MHKMVRNTFELFTTFDIFVTGRHIEALQVASYDVKRQLFGHVCLLILLDSIAEWLSLIHI